jgi:hypothetical protein
MRGRVLPLVLVLAIPAGGCTHETAATARHVGEVAAIGGVVGLVVGVFTGPYTSHTPEIMGTFSIVSGLGIMSYAIGELSEPPRGTPETRQQMHTRWAKILTERAGGAAREGNCPRVRRLEKRVNVYDREVHDFVFMRDPEIVRCLEAPVVPESPSDAPALPPGVFPGGRSESGPLHPGPGPLDPAPAPEALPAP